jgi:hypothetical protein
MPQLPKRPAGKQTTPKAAQPVSVKASRVKSPVIAFTTELIAAQKALAPAATRLRRALENLKPESLPIGAVSDLLYQLRGTIKLVPSLAEPFNDVLVPALKTLDDYFIATLKVGESSGVQGMSSRTQISEDIIPVVAAADWPKVYAYIKRTGSFELLNKALNRTAVRERWDAKKQVPGVGKFIAKKVSCTKLSGKGGAA